MTTKEIMAKVKAASAALGCADTELKNGALELMASELEASAGAIIAANAADMEAARGRISDVMLDRLLLDKARIKGMADGIRQVAKLPDPVGLTLDERVRDDGLRIRKVSVPMGVVAIIYESRPNVTSDAAALAVKSGNACILRCGREAHASAAAITAAMRRGLAKAGLPDELVMLVEDVSRESARELMCGDGYVDLLIPRGGAGLIRACVENATVPCIETGTGICHVYVDKDADLEMAVKIIVNAKTSRPSVCNAAEVCVIHEAILDRFMPMLEKALVEDRPEAPVQLRADEKALAAARYAVAAGEKDFDTEFLDYVMAVRTVGSADEAIEHIGRHSTGHSDAIVTENAGTAKRFTQLVDSAAVYVNASTRFTDGGEFGLGCEMGISTQKLHARGPMGLRELTTYKYVIEGHGNVR